MANIEFIFNPNILKQEGIPFIIIIISFLIMVLVTIYFTYKEIKKKEGRKKWKKEQNY